MSPRHGRVLFFLFVTCLAVLAVRCTTMQCNNIPQREWPSPSPSPTPLPDGVYVNPMALVAPSPSPSPSPEKIQEPAIMVFKPTGQRQCQGGGGVSLEDMKGQLLSKKIPVFESHTQADGLMHMALCGTPTGSVHVFSIPLRFKERALRLGFKEFKPRQ